MSDRWKLFMIARIATKYVDDQVLSLRVFDGDSQSLRAQRQKINEALGFQWYPGYWLNIGGLRNIPELRTKRIITGARYSVYRNISCDCRK